MPLHLLDPVQGASHFDVPEEQAVGIMQQLLLELPGFLIPKLVREVAGEGSKVPVSLMASSSIVAASASTPFQR